MSTFSPIDLTANLAQEEEEILKHWAQNHTFRKSVEGRDDAPDNQYVFYDGPPFATGLPHYGHLVASTIKDVVPRYWAMRGKRVERRFGWDTHGLPIEMEMEKKLDLSGPTSIREYGVAKFNEACRDNVLRYTDEWEKTITRLGRWVDFENDYKTMDMPFMESVWWVFAELWKRGRVYQGVRVMPFSWRLSTALSNFEANSDYRDVDDPAVTVRVKLDDDDAHLLLWTTTPWTLPSNLAVAVGKDIEYTRVKRNKDGLTYIIATALMEKILGEDVEVLGTVNGADLVGKTYEPLFSYFADHKSKGAFRVIAGDHVTTESGTGLVHMAPAFGEDDFRACQAEGIEPVDPVDDEGRFTSVVSDYAGQNIKEADKGIIKALKESAALIRHDTYRHSYPFCWRSGTPLIYKTVPVWFVKVEDLQDKMSKNNDGIHWVPKAVGEKRFGNWVKDARDWAISRNRFWGTPIPVWNCTKCDAQECLGSSEELSKRSGKPVDDLHPHKIDDLELSCEKCSAPMKRIPEVFDCWFESGSMPYAQLHYPFENKERFEASFPAQFIAEGLDQTRGWFYTLLVLSTALFDKAPFENVVVNGLVLAEDGQKMSKSKKNYPDPHKVLDAMGADALRAYLISSPVVRGEPVRFSEDGVREVVRTVMRPLRSAWSFFAQYANVDGWTPSEMESAPALSERAELDRWMLSMLHTLVKDVNIEMEGYYLYKVIPRMVGFVDDLTNWYIRRSRRRFWRQAETTEEKADKASAYATLYEVLVTFAHLLAPVIPFMTESMYQNLVAEPAGEKEASIHLQDYPMADEAHIDLALEKEMATARTIVGLGRSLRNNLKFGTRQPLSKVIVVSHNKDRLEQAQKHVALIREELNVKEVVLQSDDSELATVTLKANFKTLGKKLGPKMKDGAKEIAAMSRADFDALTAGKTVEVQGVGITIEDVTVQRSPRGDVVISSEDDLTVALDTALDDALKQEGLMREVVSKLQRMRKDQGLEITDRVVLRFGDGDAQIKNAVEKHQAHVAEEVLAASIDFAAISSGAASLDIDGKSVSVAMTKA